MNILKIITKPINIYDKKILDTNYSYIKTFYKFNENLKRELNDKKYFIENHNYFNDNNNIECHIDLILPIEKEKIINNKIIEKLVKQTIIDTDILIEIKYLNSIGKINYENNDMFLL